MGEGSEVFVLDMGEPVRIMDLARNMIRLAGLVPGKDVDIQVTGLRPGEKLFEELQLSGENVLSTPHRQIKRFRSQRPEPRDLARWLRRLRTLLLERDREQLTSHLLLLVPEYQGTLTSRRHADQDHLLTLAAAKAS